MVGLAQQDVASEGLGAVAGGGRGQHHRRRFGQSGVEHVGVPAAELGDGIGVEVADVEAGRGVGLPAGGDVDRVHSCRLA